MAGDKDKRERAMRYSDAAPAGIGLWKCILCEAEASAMVCLGGQYRGHWIGNVCADCLRAALALYERGTEGGA